jgi:hypothetical protein
MRRFGLERTKPALRISDIATHSKTELRAITKKFLLSRFENHPEPSAKFKTTLKEALYS